MNKKLISILACASMAVSVFTGCSSSNEGGATSVTTENTAVTSKSESKTTNTTTEKIEPVKMSLVFADGDEAAKTAINTIIDKFNQANEHITITYQPGNGGNYNEFLTTKDSVGEFPDIVEMRNTAVYVRADKIMPFTQELIDLFETTVSFDGEVYTAPFAAENTQGVMYNKKFFKENGLNEAPATYEAFIQLCEDIQAIGEMSPVVVGGNDLWHMGFWFNKFYNDEVIGENQDFIADLYAGTASWTEDAPKRAIQKMCDLFQYVDAGWASTPDSQLTAMLVSEKAAMLFSGSHMFSQIQEADPSFELGWFPVPDSNGKINLVGGPGSGGWSLSMEAAQDPAKVEAFTAFIKFFFEPENYVIYCEALSFVPSTVDKPDMNVSEVFQAVLDAVEIADTKQVMWNSQIGTKELPPDFRNYTYKTVVEVIQGQKTLDKAVEELDAQWKVSTVDFNPVTNP